MIFLKDPDLKKLNRSYPKDMLPSTILDGVAFPQREIKLNRNGIIDSAGEGI